MKPRHVYRPPRKNRLLSTSIIFGGGALLTYMVFYLIPLMQKLDQDRKKEKPDLIAKIKPPDKDEYTPPPEPEPEEPPPPPPEMDQASSDIPVDIPDIPMPSGGLGGRILVNVTPRVRLGGAAGMDNGGVDTEPTVSSKAKPNISPSVNRLIAKRGGIQAEISALVDENGRVVEVKISKSSGIPGADQALLNAVSRYKFRPAIRGGRKAKAKVRIPFNLRF